MDEISRQILDVIKQSFKDLFENKHLYQKVVIELSSLLKKESSYGGCGVSDSKPFEGVQEVKRIIPSLIPEMPWQLLVTNSSDLKEYAISLPRIKIFCPADERDEPFLPKNAYPFSHGRHEKKITQTFMIEYECQSCNTLVTFMVAREGVKLVLVGRSPIEEVQVPTFIPKQYKQYISGAVVAHNSGQTLPGLFMLRVFIEQYAKSCSSKTDLLANEYIELYMAGLPIDFKDKFPSFSNIYRDLSVALHMANASAELFDRTINDISDHFDAKRLYKIGV